MKVQFIFTGKTDSGWIKEGVVTYSDRLKHYCKLSVKELPDIKNSGSLTRETLKEREGERVIKELDAGDFVVLLDERGDSLSSEEFALKIESWTNRGVRNIVFVVGGAFGFSDALYKRSDAMLSLSKMTFSHQMVRVIFLEQLYRAYTILKGEPYHHK